MSARNITVGPAPFWRIPTHASLAHAGRDLEPRKPKALSGETCGAELLH